MKRISSAHWECASLTPSHLPSLWSVAVVTRPLEIQTKEKETHLFELVCISAARWVLVTARRDTAHKTDGIQNKKAKNESKIGRERPSAFRNVGAVVMYKASHQILFLPSTGAAALLRNGSLSVTAMGSK